MSSSDEAAVEAVRGISPTRAAWLATALGIPIYGLTALALSWAAAPLVPALAPDTTSFEDLAIFVSVAIVNVTIALLGIAIIAHTLGRLLFVQTRNRPTLVAARSFTIMATLLATPLVLFIALGQPLHGVGGLYAAIALGIPCGLTSGLTRALLPRFAQSPRAMATAFALGAAGFAAIIMWALVVLFGFGA